MNLSMLSLIKIEYKKHDIKKYLIGQIIGSILCVFFAIFLSLIPKFDESANDLNSLSLILSLTSIFVGMVSSFTLGAMISKFIISSYSEKQVYRTLSYPISRKKIFIGKIFSCLIFISITSAILIFLSDFFLYSFNSIFNLSFNDFNKSFILYEFKNIAITILGVLSIGVISLYFSWFKKSIVTNMISITILYSFIGNQIQIQSSLIRYLSGLFLLIIGFICLLSLIFSIEKIEL